MISLTSTWPLKEGCPPPLRRALRGLAAQVRASEPGTWMYLVHLQAPSLLDSSGKLLDPLPRPIAMKSQKAVVFVEVYADAEAFEAHINGKPFNEFRQANLPYFVENPASPGWPKTETVWLERESGCFSFPQAGGAGSGEGGAR